MAQRSWSSIAFLLAFVSLVFTFIAFVIGLILAFVTSSSATLGCVGECRGLLLIDVGVLAFL